MMHGRRLLTAIVLLSSVGLISSCGDERRERESAPGLRSTTSSVPVPVGGGFGDGPHQGACLQRPEGVPLPDWLPNDLPLPEGSYTVLELLIDAPNFRSVVVSVPLEYDDFVAYARDEWARHGWSTETFDAEPGESENAFVRADEYGSFRARRLYCEENWSEIALYVGVGQSS